MKSKTERPCADRFSVTQRTQVMLRRDELRVPFPDNSRFDEVAETVWQDLCSRKEDPEALRLMFTEMLADKFYYKLKNQELKKKILSLTVSIK
jgi:hypothetical protein